jgi:RimJ/RimL family protein N-acetyltransferase
MNQNEVVIRPFRMDDKEKLAQLANNKKLWDNLRDYIPYPYSLTDAEEYISFCTSQNPQTYFAVEYNGEFVGSIGLILQTDVYRKSAEIGYWIGEPFWGKGIASKAVALIVDYGFQNLDIVRIFTGIFGFNIGSQRVLEKKGFIKEAVFKKEIYKNGIFSDEIQYAIWK